MDVKEAGSSLDEVVSSFNARIAELQQLVIGRNMSPASTSPDLSAVDASVTAMELQVQAIKDRLREESQAIPKAKKLIDAALQQQKKLQSMSVHVLSNVPERLTVLNPEINKSSMQESFNKNIHSGFLKQDEELTALPKEKKKRASPPLWYITADELESLSSYMRGRLTLEKVNAAISDMAMYAEANAQLISAPRNKLPENTLEKAMELRNIATADTVKGKHFFVENDIKGPSLKLDNTGKAILTVLRHLGRVSETRVGHHRVIILNKTSMTA